jgi:putative transposase
LPVPYFHVVFTLPHAMAPLAWANQRLVYDILFRAAADTLLEIAADPKHLGAKIGVLAVLHTWGQNLSHHPHVHCVVPGGGLSPDGARWIACRDNFFLPVKVLSRVFRGKFLARLHQEYQRDALVLPGESARLAAPRTFQTWLSEAYRTDWVVYAKPPFGGPEQVLKYLARYTHRVAISNDRLLDMKDGQVTFRYKNYREGQRWQTMRLAATEFLRRFLTHVVPQRFVRIRHFGLLANRHRQAHLERCRGLLAAATKPPPSSPDSADPTPRDHDTARPACPICPNGRLHIRESWPRPRLSQVLRFPLAWAAPVAAPSIRPPPVAAPAPSPHENS